MKITEWLEAQKKLFAAATPGPWEYVGHSGTDYTCEECGSEFPEAGYAVKFKDQYTVLEVHLFGLENLCVPNATFIASVRTEHERALKIIEKMREALLSWEKCVKSGLVGSDNLAGDLALSIVIGQSISALNYFPDDGNSVTYEDYIENT